MTAEQLEAAARRFIALVEARDMEAWFDLYAPDATNHFPLHSGLFGPEVVGREAIREAWADFPRFFAEVHLTIDELFVDVEERVVVICMDSHNRVDMDAPGNPWTHAGPDYANRFVAILRYDAEGQVTDYVEYYNPLVTGAALGAIDARPRAGWAA